MIEIIRPGTKKQVECPNCGALLSYDAVLDVEREEEKAIGTLFPESLTKVTSFIKCPQCDNKIIFKQTR